MADKGDKECPIVKQMRVERENKKILDMAMEVLRAKPIFQLAPCPVVVKFEADKAAGKYEEKLPSQYTFEDWQNRDTPTPKIASKCYHDWQMYNGFHFDDFYCIKCGETRPLDPSK